MTIFLVLLLAIQFGCLVLGMYLAATGGDALPFLFIAIAGGPLIWLLSGIARG